MASTFFGLNIAYTGLLAANANVNTTGNNISNVETKGYSRQQVVQTAADALRVNSMYGMAGSGVNTTEITQIRDKYYDLKYWQSQTNLGQYEIKEYYNLQIENYFTETENTEGFGTIFSNMFASLDEVRKQSGEGTVKNQFLADAGNLCEYFNAMANNLERLQLDANAEIKNKVDEINSIAEQIATLNKQINTIEVTGAHANELRDKRALLVDDLSKIIDVEIRETPIPIASGSKTNSGLYNYEVCIANQVLVDGYDYNTLRCIARQDKVNESDAEGLYDIRWTFGDPNGEYADNGLPFDLYGRNLGGELKGLIEIRDGNNGEYFHGTVSDSVIPFVIDDIPGAGVIARPCIVVDIGNDDLKDVNKTTLPCPGVITVGGRELHYDTWKYKDGKYTFAITDTDDEGHSIDLSAYKDGAMKVDVTIGREVDYQGIPYYQEQMNEFVRIFAKAMNDIEKTAQDVDGNPAEALFTARNLVTSGSSYDFDNEHSDSFSSYADNYHQLNAKNFQVNQNMVKNVDKFGTTYDINQGPDAQDITEKLLTVQHSKERVNFRGSSANEFLQCLTSDVALNTNNAVTFTKNYTDINKAVANQRTSVMGVDNDEEALNLVKFQEAYNLAAKMMQVMTEIYDQLILNTGV